MSISIKRGPVYIFGIIIILLCCYYSRISFYSKGKITWGKVLNNITWRGNRTTYSASIVKFTVADYEYTFHAETNVHYLQNEIVPVIYNPDDPTDVKVLTFLGFWFTPILYSILPLLVFTAALFSFMSTDQAIKIGFKQNNIQ